MAPDKKNKDVGDVIGDTVFKAVKPLYKEGERQRRAPTRRRPQKRNFYKPEPKWSQKRVVFAVMPQAIRNAGYGPSVRDLYYAVRPLAYAHPQWPEEKRLEYGYFADTLSVQYERERGRIKGLWRDPRGHLHEAHALYALPLRDPYGEVADGPERVSVALGTREVDAYSFPPYLFDKILYVEKEGEWPKLLEAKIPERYDMAIVSSKGYATTAVRDLLQKAATGQNYQIFAFHDADIDGYEIERTLREATWRMPEHSVEVIDIGLTIRDALEIGLESEPYYRKGGVPDPLERRLTSEERQYFSGTHGERFELNAILPVERRIEYIEEKLKENGVRPKLIPPDEELKKRARDIYRDKHAEWVDEMIADMLSLGTLKKELADKFEKDLKLEKKARAYIEEAFEKDKTLPWHKALSRRLGEVLREEKTEDLGKAISEELSKRLGSDDGSAEGGADAEGED